MCLSVVHDVQGKTLTVSVKQIFTDFQAAADKFQKLPYDVIDVDAKQFPQDFAAFCGVIQELERRLGAVIAQVSTLVCVVASCYWAT